MCELVKMMLFLLAALSTTSGNIIFRGPKFGPKGPIDNRTGSCDKLIRLLYKYMYG